MSVTPPQNFQVNLAGVIDLLSNHLYSGPHVFVRELLQNAVDAIRARQGQSAGASPWAEQGLIRLELIPATAGGGAATLVVEDNGIGLAPEEVHAFLSTIGQSSKRDALSAAREDFIGQFGIGLLSCFIVSEEIVLITRSANGGPTLEWRGRNDGTYELKELATQLEPGTKVYLRCRQGLEEYFERERLVELARHYGGLLPFPICFVHQGNEETINAEPPPWQQSHAGPQERLEAYMTFGAALLEESDFFDVVPLDVPQVGLKGAAYVLPYASAAARKQTHRVYLKQMFLAEAADNLLPEWAFFVTCIVDAHGLRPTASRESFYEDDALAETREALGKTLRNYLIRLAEHDPERLKVFIALHHHSIGALVLADDEAYRVFADFFPVETSLGRMALGEYRAQRDTIRYVTTHEQFRQIAPVAAARQEAVIDASYVYMREILERLERIAPGVLLQELDTATLAREFDEVEAGERETCERLLRLAREELASFECDAVVKRFEPQSMPVLYSLDAEGSFWRSLEQSKEVADSLWSGLLDDFARAKEAEPWQRDAVLCFNHANPLVRKLTQQADESVLRTAVRVLYVQSLLLGHHPLRSRELDLLNESLTEMLERSARS